MEIHDLKYSGLKAIGNARVESCKSKSYSLALI